MAPVISAVPAGSSGAGTVRMTFPVWRAWLRNRNASGARRTSQAVTGRGWTTPWSARVRMSVSIRWIRSSPADISSNAW